MKNILEPGSWSAAAYDSLKTVAHKVRIAVAEEFHPQPQASLGFISPRIEQPRSSYEMVQPFLERRFEEKIEPQGRGFTLGPPDPRFAPIILVPDVK